MTRAASDGYEDEQNRTNKERMREGDDGGLSKLSGVSRSVSWGRGTAQHRPTLKAQKESVSKNTSNTPSRPGWKSHHARASLSMSPSIDTSQIPKIDDDTVLCSPVPPKSSPASSAALSLRSVNSNDMEKAPRLNALDNGSNGSSVSSPSIHAHESTTVLSPSPRRRGNLKGLRLDLDTPDSQSPNSTTFPYSLKSAFLSQSRGKKETPLTSPVSTQQSGSLKYWTDSGPFSPKIFSPQMPQSNSMMPRKSLPSTDIFVDMPIRRHMGSFQSRAQILNPELSPRLPPSVEEQDLSASSSEVRPGAKLARNLARFRHDPSHTFSRSGSNTPWPLSPRAARLPTHSMEDLRSSTSSLRSNVLALSVPSILPRPPQSPMLLAEQMNKLDLSDEDGAEIHGLTTRSATPSRPDSPTHAGSEMQNIKGFQEHLYQNFLAPGQAQNQNSSSIDSYEVGETIGSGSYGFVHRGKSKENGDDVVIKYIIKNSIFADSWRRHRVYGTIPGEIFVLLQLQHTKYVPPEQPPPYIKNKTHWKAVRDALISEAHGESIMGHPGICKLADFFEDDDYYYMVMPKFGDGEDLFDYVESSPYGLDIQDVRSFLGQIIDVIAFMHASGIVHRDIKDENVILESHGMIQVIDFGSATKLRPGRTFDTFSGTMDYAAAEILRGERYTGPPQDIWAYGVLAYVLVCGECPFHDMDEASNGLSAGSKSLKTLSHFCLEQSINVPNEGSSVRDNTKMTANEMEQREQLYDLICQCLQVDPTKRPSAQDILQHRFFVEAGWIGTSG